MTDAILGLFGPLALPECLRASRRGWLIWVRLVPAAFAGLVAFLVAWFWATLIDFDAAHLPYQELRIGLTAVAAMLVALALIIPPAVLAGSLAGEKERGSIGLLLSTQASAADIVLSRWVGRLAPVGLVAAAVLPLLLGMASLAGFNPPVVLAMLGLPLAVGLGGGGFALGVSAVSRRGRDALLLIYLVEIIAMLGSLFAAPLLGSSNLPPMAEALVAAGLGAINPFGALVPLIWGERVAPAAVTAGLWAVLGLVGLAVASWRLRPSCLNDGSGTNRKARRFRRRWGHRVPPVGTRPMLWKELHIERAGSLGRVGRWLGGLLVLWLGLGSVVLGVLSVREDARMAPAAPVAAPAPAAAVNVNATGSGVAVTANLAAAPVMAAMPRTGYAAILGEWYGDTDWLISFLIEWAIGLRAAVAIASERERGTWDGLMTSPLTGAEIVRGKLWGSLYALRWLIAAALLAWTITWACGGMTTRAYLAVLGDTATVGALMAAGGVALSLRSATATRAMATTLACWLGAYIGLTIVAFALSALGAGACLLGWLAMIQMGLADPGTSPWFPIRFETAMEWSFCGVTALLAVLIIAATRLRFDRAAGRMTGGAAAVAVDAFLRGRPMPPVRLDPKPPKPGPLADWEADMLAPPAG